MCFSATASFTGAACIGTIGLFLFKYVREKKELPLALVPIFFAIQQFSEGILWLQLENLDHAFLKQYAMNLYLFVALILWPFWIPFSFFILEKNPMRKKGIFFLLLLGSSLTALNTYYAMSQTPDAKIVGASLQYQGILPEQKLWYAAVVVLPSLFSSFKNAWQFGLLILVTALAADYLYSYVYLSVWCFFSAIMSAWLLKIFRDNTLLSKERELKW